VSNNMLLILNVYTKVARNQRPHILFEAWNFLKPSSDAFATLLAPPIEIVFCRFLSFFNPLLVGSFTLSRAMILDLMEGGSDGME